MTLKIEPRSAPTLPGFVSSILGHRRLNKMNLIQLSFDFTNDPPRHKTRMPIPWQVLVLAKRHRLPIQRAAVIAELAGLGGLR
jgi:hypothetical protein